MRILATVSMTMLATALFASVDYQDLQDSIRKGESQVEVKKRIAEQGIEFALNRSVLKKMKQDQFPNWLIDHLVAFERERSLDHHEGREEYPRRYQILHRHDLYRLYASSAYYGWYGPALGLLNAWCYPSYWGFGWSPWWDYSYPRYRFGYGYRYYCDNYIGYTPGGRRVIANNGGRIGRDGYRSGRQEGRRAIPRGQSSGVRRGAAPKSSGRSAAPRSSSGSRSVAARRR